MIAFLFQPSRHGGKSRLWSARIRLNEWPKYRVFPMHVTDKRVADQKMRELVKELERETHGIGVPQPIREAWRIPLTEHHAKFVRACEGARLSKNTIAKYKFSLPKLFERCKWTAIREITASSFIAWRDSSTLAPKSLNDFLGSMRTFLLWMKSQRLILADPLSGVKKMANPGVGSFRRSLSQEDVRQLLEKSPPHRALVYLTMVYTGLRRAELNGLKWGDFDFTKNPPELRVPSSISKNRKESTHYLRPELAEAILARKPNGVRPDVCVFRRTIPRVHTFKRDLEAAGIPFEDTRGRRVDLHALRKTFGTLLASSGVSPRVAMEMMRHSDMKLTMGVYTDVSQLPIIQESARLPSFRIPSPSAAKEAGTLASQSAQKDEQPCDNSLVSPRETPEGAHKETHKSLQIPHSSSLFRPRAPAALKVRIS